MSSGRNRPRDTFYRGMHNGLTEAQAQIATATLHGPLEASEFGYEPGVSERQAALDTVTFGVFDFK